MVEKATEKMRYQARLHRRGNIFYFRAKIPQDLLEHFKPRREIKFSLGTSDKRLAVARVHEVSGVRINGRASHRDYAAGHCLLA